MEKNIIIENSYEKFSIDKKYDKVLILTDENVYKSQFNLFIDNVNHDSIETYIVKSFFKSFRQNFRQKHIQK